MPKIFEYWGLLYFSTLTNTSLFMYMLNMGRALESKAEFYIINGEISEIRIELVNERKPLNTVKLKDLEKFLEKYADKIVEKWIDYFVYHKEVTFEKINKLK